MRKETPSTQSVFKVAAIIMDLRNRSILGNHSVGFLQLLAGSYRLLLVCKKAYAEFYQG